MAFWRRRGSLGPAVGDEPGTAGEPTNPDPVDVLDLRLQAVDARLADVEARVAVAQSAADLLPEHGDVLDVQVRAAKLAAELHLVQLELARLRSGSGGPPSPS